VIGWAVRRFHAALTRPFRRADIDWEARERIERRQREIAARLAGYRQWRAATDLRRQREGM
jgi:hypothetical protein